MNDLELVEILEGQVRDLEQAVEYWRNEALEREQDGIKEACRAYDSGFQEGYREGVMEGESRCPDGY